MAFDTLFGVLDVALWFMFLIACWVDCRWYLGLIFVRLWFIGCVISYIDWVWPECGMVDCSYSVCCLGFCEGFVCAVNFRLRLDYVFAICLVCTF